MNFHKTASKKADLQTNGTCPDHEAVEDDHKIELLYDVSVLQLAAPMRSSRLVVICSYTVHSHLRPLHE